ncbi:MAG: Lrp/AsnC family transcriptional regulator [Candidatus Aenigmatarchaeota archaeon]
MARKIAKNSEKVRIDKKDIEIIKILEENGRIPILKLAKKVKLSHETVRYRLNKLIKTGVIEKFIVRINKKKLGYNIYAVIMIATWNYTKDEWDEFFEYLIKHKNIVSVEKITGNYDLKIATWAKDPENFDLISHSIKTKFSKIIKDWQTFIFTRQYKWKELPF